MRAKALSRVLTLASALISTSAHADQDRILFVDGAEVPVSDGAHGAANARALARLGGLVKSWPAASPWSLIVVADRSDTCRGVARCEAPMMLWRRQGAVAVKALSAGGAPARRPALREAFLDELSPKPTVSTPVAGHTALHVRLFTEAAKRPAGCPIDVAVEDETLPSTLSGTWPLASHGQHIPLGATARLTTLLGSAPTNATIVLWELSDGTFCRAGSDTPLIEGVPSTAKAVHFVFGKSPQHSKIPSSPTRDCTSDTRRTIAENTAGSRGMHGHGRHVAQGTVQPSGISCVLTVFVTPVVH